MGEVSTSHVFHQPNDEEQEQEQQQPEPDFQALDSISSWSNDHNNDIHDDDLYAFDFDPLCPPNASFFTSSATYSHNFCPYTDSDLVSDSDSDSNNFHGEEDQMNFITDLFASREEEYIVDDQDSASDPFLGDGTHNVNVRGFNGSDGFSSNYGLELGLGCGSHAESDRVAFASGLSESSVTRGANLSTEGLRVVGMESESDSEEVVQDVNSGVCDDGTDPPLGDSDIPLFWDCLGFEEQRVSNEELEWEEVDGRVDEREGLSSVIDRIEELSVSSEVSSNEETSDVRDEAVRSLEWEVLLAVNNLERAHDFDHDGDNDGVSYLVVREDYLYAAEYDTLFGQFVQNERALKGSPPAAKAVVENLPSVVLTKEELQENNVVCAVCKDEVLVEEKVTRLPCRHHYHGDCIIPWLCIHNTCPVCRYELPTDDLDYEQMKTQREDLGPPQDLQILEFIYEVAESRQIGA